MNSRIFRDREKLLPHYIPPYFPHRESQLRQLINAFQPMIRGELPATQAIIVGNPGVGKTMLAKKLIESINELAKMSNLAINTVYINCRVERTPGNIVRQFTSKIIDSIPLRGLSVEEMFITTLKHCVSKNEKVFMILDDADHLFSMHKEFIYMISRIGELSSEYNRLSLLIVIHDLGVFSSLDSWTAGGLRKNVIHFSDYNYEQLLDILNYRVEEAFQPGVVLPESIETCADISSQHRFNARYALELMLKAGEIAEVRGSSIVIPEYIRLARREVPPSFSIKEIHELPLHEKLVLLSLSSILKNTYKSYVSTGELEKEYKAICEEMKVAPVKHTWFWKIVNNLYQLGFISKKLSGKGLRGRTTLIELPSMAAEALEKILRRELIEKAS